MGKNKKSSGKKKKGGGGGGGISASNGVGLMVDPARVRFQHSRIRPIFSGCGRSVEGTLEEIRKGKVKPSDLPPIQVIVGPDDVTSSDGPWYFSLNNRRLWVLKRCREEGLLPNNQIFVRVRKPKSEQEALRYSIENCALEAKIISEKAKSTKPEGNMMTQGSKQEDEETIEEETPSIQTRENANIIDDENSTDDDSSDDSITQVSNRFSAFL